MSFFQPFGNPNNGSWGQFSQPSSPPPQPSPYYSPPIDYLNNNRGAPMAIPVSSSPMSNTNAGFNVFNTTSAQGYSSPQNLGTPPLYSQDYFSQQAPGSNGYDSQGVSPALNLFSLFNLNGGVNQSNSMGTYADGSNSVNPQSLFPRPPREFVLHTSRQVAQVEVPLQRSYTGCLAIPSSMANQSCQSLGVTGILNLVNDLMGFARQDSDSALLSVLQRCISAGDDFGLAYARLRPNWQGGFTTYTERMDIAERKRQRRVEAKILGTQIFNLKIPPRRIWDLYSNRVIPGYWAPEEKKVVPISHAWVDVADRTNIITPINNREWPVPVPVDADFEGIRIELLNLGLEYVWLDVLCLRQRGDPEREETRGKEWKVDVPTIGYAYRRYSGNNRVAVYFSGLGRPFRAENMDSLRHWFKRAWTVQEAAEEMIAVGVTPFSPSTSERGNYPAHQQFYDRLEEAKKLVGNYRPTISEALNIMQLRDSTSEVDKISGLANVIGCHTLPVFDEKESPESAWTNLIAAMTPSTRAHLLFWYPTAGEGPFSWAPSWDQLRKRMAEPHMQQGVPLGHIRSRKDATEYGGYCVVFHNATVHGLSVPNAASSELTEGTMRGERRGVVLVADQGGRDCGVSVVARHSVAIAENSMYTLLLSHDYGFLVVGTTDSGRFHKLCVLQVPEETDYRSMGRLGEQKDITFA